MNSLKYLNKIFLFCLVMLAINARAQTGEGVIIDEIIAKVDNYIVLKSELEKAYLNYLSSGNQAAPDTKCRILAQLISGKLMVAKAEIDSVIVSDLEVDNQLQRRMQVILSQYGGTEEQFEQYYGKTIEELQAEIRDQVKEQMVVQRMQETITADVSVTPAEVRKFFNQIPRDSLPFFSTEMEVSQIVKIPEPNETIKSQIREQLAVLRSRALQGESFEALAKEYSQGPSGPNGGNLGWASRGMMAPEYEANSLKLKPGEISEPFETSFGIHIVQLLERRGNEYNSRHIIIIPEPSEEDVRSAEKFLDSLRTRINEDTLTFTTMAREYSDDKLTSSSGGFFTDSQGSLRVAAEEMDPVIYLALDSMEVGSISKPTRFRTLEEKEAVRILFYKSKLPPHQANLKDDWQKIQNAALNEKKNRILNEWFNKARNDVFINIDDEYDYCGIVN
ncbi:peptidylprolyl isomerase [Fulvivirga sedimenti]|uniref:Peptidylprolyl isomerase n=1 Tax=Fulvivirga sedimenti TaxID=2879465 RepID=A0A9X1KZH7_9BACT|nr:peptidylprolyl isomerase [Fulvivirga sedimenti]MCA6078275.1 peptidylprolyl isomerase [Fulvivirga sedimenti]